LLEGIRALDDVLTSKENVAWESLFELREELKSLVLEREAERDTTYTQFGGASARACIETNVEKPLVEDDRNKVTGRVSFSVTSPLAIAPADVFPLGVWVHSDDQRAIVLRRAQDEGWRNVRIATRGPVQIPDEVLLTIQVSIPAFDVIAEDTIGWFGKIGHASFVVAVPADAPRGPVAGSLLVYAGALRISRLDFLLEVGAKTVRIRRARTIERRVRRGFASYASTDRDEVMGRIQGMLKIAPELDIFVDVLSLRSGERWETRLEQEIAARDVLYLFWSSAASRSEMVDREWRCALEKRGLAFIDPVPLQPPSIAPPPTELSSLHFSDWTLAFKR
jgi:hypothetical protein